MNKRCFIVAGISIGSLLAVVPPFVRAQAAPENSSAPQSAKNTGTGIQEVVVMATRRAENQQDVPLAITALDGEFLHQNAINNLTDLNGHVPALRIDSFNSPSYTNVGIRAQRSANVAPGQDSAVGYYMAELNYAYPVGINQQLFDLQSLEIVKGPQGTLFGRNTTGGAVVVTPTEPTGVFGAKATAGVTRFNGRMGYYTTDVLNLPVNDVVQLRLGINAVNRDGYVKNKITDQQLASYEVTPNVGTTSGKALNNEESTAWRLGMLVTPNDSIESYFLYLGSKLRTRGTAYSLTAVNPAGFANIATTVGGVPNGAAATYQRRKDEQSSDFWTTEQGNDIYNHLETHMLMNRTTWTISDNLTLKNVIGGRRFKLDDSLNLSGMPYQILDVTISDHGREWSEELQLQGETDDGDFNWVAGVFYSDQHIDHPNSTTAVPQFGGLPTDAGDVSDNDSHAVFFQGTYKLPFIEGLSFTAGARRTTDNREMTATKFVDKTDAICNLFDSGGVRLSPDNCALHAKTSFLQNTFNLNLDYKIDEQTLVYLARRRGYRSGGWNYVPDNPETFGPFNPEIVMDWETGLKKDWRIGSASVRTNAAIYRQDYKGIQRFSAPLNGNPSSFVVLNAADAVVKGGELELTVIPVQGLEIGGFYSRIDAKYNDFVTGAGDFSDSDFAQVPKEQYSLRVRYELPLDSAIGTLSVAADYTRQSHIFFSDTAEGPNDGPKSSQGQDAYGILNLRVDWTAVMRSNFDLAFYVKNATATKYNAFGVQVYQSLGYNVATIGEPRILGLEGTYRFNM